MKKIIIYNLLFFSFNIWLNISFCSSFSRWLETEQDKKRKLAHTIYKPWIDDINNNIALKALEKDEHIKTQSQKPIQVHPHCAFQVNISKLPQEEMLIKKTSSGSDGMEKIEFTEQWPNSVHGLIAVRFRNTPEGDYVSGTGTFIAPNIVLTAAHNFYNRRLFDDDKPIGKAIEVRFFPAMNGNRPPFQEASIGTYYYSKTYVDIGREDYGLLILKEPVGDMTGYFGLSIIPEHELKQLTLNVTGYPGEKVKYKPKYWYEMWGMGGPVKDIYEGMIHYEITTYSGQSGSGVWYQEGENYFIAGVHVLYDPILDLNKATLLTHVHYEQITDWIKDFVTKRIISLCESSDFSSLTKLNLRGVNQGSEWMLEDIGSYCTSLKYLDASAWEKIKIFPAVSYPYLERLILNECINLNEIAIVAPQLEYLEAKQNFSLQILSLQAKELESINFQNCLLLQNSMLNQLARGSPLLKNIEITGCDMPYSDTFLQQITKKTPWNYKLNEIINGIINSPFLTRLFINHFPDETLTLTYINADQNEHGITRTFRHLLPLVLLNKDQMGIDRAQNVSFFINLKELNLKDNEIGDVGAQYLSTLTNLTRLELLNNAITNVGAQHLSLLKNLTYLSLHCNRIGPGGAKALSVLINLEKLFIACNQIGTTGALHLTSLINLKGVSLWSNNIKNEKKILENFKKKLPNCFVSFGNPIY